MHVSDRVRRRAQQVHGPFDSAALQVPMRRLTECRFEGADEVRLRDARNARERSNVEFVAVAAIHHVAGAQHQSVRQLPI